MLYVDNNDEKIETYNIYSTEILAHTHTRTHTQARACVCVAKEVVDRTRAEQN